MEQADKDTIQRNLVSLSDDMDFVSVSIGLLARKILENHHVDKFNSKPCDREKNLALLTYIQTKGPGAFASLVDSLNESNQVHLALKLHPSTGSSQGQMVPAQATTAHENRPAPFDQPTQQVPPVWPARDSTGDYSSTQMDALGSYPQTMVDSDLVYKMKSRSRGIALIINNKNFKTMKKRAGTDVDYRNLENVFNQLGFNVVGHNDLTGSGMVQAIEEQEKRDHSQFDCFIFVILTHGKEGLVYGTDGSLMEIEDIVGRFGSGRCPTLNGKPKLFFLQACRGQKMDEGVEATDGTDQENSRVESQMDEDQLAKMMPEMEVDSTDSLQSIYSRVPSHGDMLLAYATVPGFVSWRSSKRGSWFIQALTEVFLQHAKDEDLLSMITMVNDKVARAFESFSGRHKQMPAPVTMLRKKLYFFPGHY